MRPARLEALALEAIDRVLRGAGTEDARIEFKSTWPADHSRAARQLAGHCNASSGDDVIWIIGVDESGKISGCNPADCAEWWSQVQAHFNEKPPTLLSHVAVAGQAAPVIALAFSSADAPFVVLNPVRNSPGGGPVESEVPWREGSRTRSARRQDLVRLLGRRLRMPSVEIVSQSLSPRTSVSQSFSGPTKHHLDHWVLAVEVAVLPEPGMTLRYLLHRSSISVGFSTPETSHPKAELRIVPASFQRHPDHISGVRLDGSIVEILRAATLELEITLEYEHDVRYLECESATIVLCPAGDEPEIRIDLPEIHSEHYER